MSTIGDTAEPPSNEAQAREPLVRDEEIIIDIAGVDDEVRRAVLGEEPQ